MNWDSAVEGELILECTIFVPYHFEGFDVVSSGTATTNPVTWSIEDDDSTNLVLPISIGLVAAVVIFVLIFRRQMSIEAAKEYSHITEEVDDEAEESGVIE